MALLALSQLVLFSHWSSILNLFLYTFYSPKLFLSFLFLSLSLSHAFSNPLTVQFSFKVPSCRYTALCSLCMQLLLIFLSNMDDHIVPRKVGWTNSSSSDISSNFLLRTWNQTFYPVKRKKFHLQDMDL